MSKVDFGQWLTVGANVAVLLGILLLVYELNQARTFAATEFRFSNTLGFQDIERSMLDPELAELWVKAADDPTALAAAEIRMLDAWMIIIYNYLRNYWSLEQLGLLPEGKTAEELTADVAFFFGNPYAQVWWEDLKQFHIEAGSSEIHFDRMIDDALEGVSADSNIKYIQRMQNRLEERFGGAVRE